MNYCFEIYTFLDDSGNTILFCYESYFSNLKKEKFCVKVGVLPLTNSGGTKPHTPNHYVIIASILMFASKE